MPESLIAVRRTGGLLGGVASGSVEVRHASPSLLELVDRVLAAPPPRSGLPQPDHFVYEFDLRGTVLVAPEQWLTDDLRRLAELLLVQTP